MDIEEDANAELRALMLLAPLTSTGKLLSTKDRTLPQNSDGETHKIEAETENGSASRDSHYFPDSARPRGANPNYGKREF